MAFQRVAWEDGDVKEGRTVLFRVAIWGSEALARAMHLEGRINREKSLEVIREYLSASTQESLSLRIDRTE
jgi:hypothetical protein